MIGTFFCMKNIKVTPANSLPKKESRLLTPRARRRIKIGFALAAAFWLVAALAGAGSLILGALLLLFSVVVIAMSRYYENWYDSFQYVELTTKGISVYVNDKCREKLDWKSLSKVFIWTTTDGPFAEDFYWVLSGADQGVVIRNEHAIAVGLFDVIMQLPGADPMAIVAACGCVEEAFFDVWERDESRPFAMG